ncbi:serpin A3-5-like [Scomber scombrus]|uniref:Thyroxine-binding globulin n=1 Tax=Scomber scombrus TaxID=13677 RepID=A0AAV1MUE3_SCOSC
MLQSDSNHISLCPVCALLSEVEEEFTMMRAVLSIWILSAVAYVGRGHQHKGPIKVKHRAGQDTESISLVASANKEFAYHLYRKLAAHADSQGKNIFFSPVSVSVALAALSVGARAETHRQIFSGLGFNNSLLTQTVVDQAFRTLLERANNTSKEDTSEGTAVFVDNSFKPKPEFLDVLKKSYFADGFQVDFTKTTDSTNTINKYVEEKTNGKIDKLVEDLDPSTVMYLISYIYFKGKWQTPFDLKLAKEDTFTIDENTKVPVQMMNMEEDVDSCYNQAINTSVLHLPFNMDDVQFSIKTSYSLKDVLTEMGMTDMFDYQADLSGISEGQKMTVSEIVRQATLDIDEAGATAAAATGPGYTPMSFYYVPVLRFDRPFMVLITERNTENILFMVKIINPNI